MGRLDRASPKSLHALTARAEGAHRERKVLAVGCADRQHLPLQNGSLASRSDEKERLRSPGRSEKKA